MERGKLLVQMNQVKKRIDNEMNEIYKKNDNFLDLKIKKRKNLIESVSKRSWWEGLIQDFFEGS